MRTRPIIDTLVCDGDVVGDNFCGRDGPCKVDGEVYGKVYAPCVGASVELQ